MGTCLTIGLPLASTFKTYLPPQGRGGSTEKRPYAQVFFGTLRAGSAATSLKRSWLGKCVRSVASGSSMGLQLGKDHL